MKTGSLRRSRKVETPDKRKTRREIQTFGRLYFEFMALEKSAINLIIAGTTKAQLLLAASRRVLRGIIIIYLPSYETPFLATAYSS